MSRKLSERHAARSSWSTSTVAGFVSIAALAACSSGAANDRRDRHDHRASAHRGAEQLLRRACRRGGLLRDLRHVQGRGRRRPRRLQGRPRGLPARRGRSGSALRPARQGPWAWRTWRSWPWRRRPGPWRRRLRRRSSAGCQSWRASAASGRCGQGRRPSSAARRRGTERSPARSPARWWRSRRRPRRCGRRQGAARLLQEGPAAPAAGDEGVQGHARRMRGRGHRPQDLLRRAPHVREGRVRYGVPEALRRQGHHLRRPEHAGRRVRANHREVCGGGGLSPLPAGFAGCLPLVRARPAACARTGEGRFGGAFGRSS